jgi:hypothetical protein
MSSFKRCSMAGFGCSALYVAENFPRRPTLFVVSVDFW